MPDLIDINGTTVEIARIFHTGTYRAFCRVGGKLIERPGRTKEDAVKAITPIVRYAQRYFRSR